MTSNELPDKARGHKITQLINLYQVKATSPTPNIYTDVLMSVVNQYLVKGVCILRGLHGWSWPFLDNIILHKKKTSRSV